MCLIGWVSFCCWFEVVPNCFWQCAIVSFWGVVFSCFMDVWSLPLVGGSLFVVGWGGFELFQVDVGIVPHWRSLFLVK